MNLKEKTVQTMQKSDRQILGDYTYFYRGICTFIDFEAKNGNNTLIVTDTYFTVILGCNKVTRSYMRRVLKQLKKDLDNEGFETEYSGLFPRLKIKW